jgi:uncharacterized protein YkwD
MDATIGKGRRALVVLSILVVGLVGQALAPAGAGAATRHRDHMTTLTNQDRTSHAKTVLALDAKLSRYARHHSRAMAEAGYLYHSDDLAAVLGNRDWSLGGENVGVGTTLDGLEQAFMASKDHRKNILRKTFDHVAIGIVKSDDVYWVTVIFYG